MVKIGFPGRRFGSRHRSGESISGEHHAIKRKRNGFSSDSFWQFVRYIVSGSIGATSDILLFSFLTYLAGVHYLISNIAGFLLSLVLTYFLNRSWVFSGSRINDRFKEFALFVLLSMISIAISEVLMFLFVGLSGMDRMVSKVVVTLVTVVYSFTVRKLFLFY